MPNGNQQILNEIRTHIPGCFGDQDRIFAMHTLDADKARFILRLLLDARDNGIHIIFSDVLSLFEEYLRGLECTEEHIHEQLNRIIDINNYF